MEKIRKNKALIVLILVLLGAAFLRLYNISHYQTFLGDEGRDALVVKGILEGDLTLLGPRASAGDFYLGPIYYYLMAPFLLLAGYDPVGPAIMIALLSVATVYLIYRFGKEWFGVKAGLYAASLYAVSPLVIAYSRSSWNPNPLPFFSLLILYLLFKGVQDGGWKKFVIAGVFFGVAMQLHYLAVFLGVIMGLFVFGGTWMVKKKLDIVTVFKYYGEIVLGFLIGLSPFLLFEARHGFPNTKTIFEFIFNNNLNSEYVGGHGSFLDIILDVFFRLFGRLVTRFPSPQLQHLFTNQTLEFWHIATVVLALFSVIILLRNKNKITILLFSLWLFVGVILFGFYKKPIYDYYFTFMFPLPFLLVGNALGEGLVTTFKQKWVVFVGGGIFAFLLLFNLYDMPFRYAPNNQKQIVENISDTVLSKTEGKPFNFALITKGNSDHAYRYFFHLRGRDPVVIDNTVSDPERKTVTGQLLIICDYADCKPLGNSLFEVAGFGRGEITGRWETDGVVIYRLIPYTGE